MPEDDSPERHLPAAHDLAVCPLCKTLVPPAAFEDHLRQSHRLYTYRGVRRTLDDTLEAMAADVVSTRPDPAAWQALVRLAREEQGPGADRFLTGQLSQALSRLDDRRQQAVGAAIAPLVAPGNAALVVALAHSPSVPSRRLALLCIQSLSSPFDRRLRRALRGLVADKALPTEARFDALAAALPHLEKRRAARLLSPLLVGRRRREAVAFVDRLEARAGPLPVLAALRDRLGDRVRMACPRCGVEMRKHLMLAHLWGEHGLVLDGTRVREPWNVVEDWLAAAQATRDQKLVERCKVAVEKIDPQRGMKRLTRLLLARGLADSTTRRVALNEAREQHASCCPACFALVPVPVEQPALAVKLRDDRLTGGGYRVLIDEQGLQPRLEVATPTSLVFSGIELDRAWTASGTAFIWTSILVLSTLICAMLCPPSWVLPWKPVAFLLLLAGLLHQGILLAFRGQTPVKERLIDFTWRLLVPELHSGGFRLTDSAFAAGLAAWYSRQGLTEAPPAPLADLVRVTEQAVERGDAPAGHLAALVRLQIEQAAAEGRDPIPLVTRGLARCFQGKLSLAFAQQLLEGWAADWWSRANLARLRILLCDCAFEAGFEVQNLLDAGQTAPALGTVLGVEAPRSLAALRLLWSMRPSRPWDRLGEVQTAFELAVSPQRAEPLAEQSDLLLFELDRGVEIEYERGSEKRAPARIEFTLAGLWLQGIIFSIPPRVFEVRRKSFGSQLILGLHVFRSSVDLDPFSREVERWFRWVFHEFLPQVDRVLTWQSPHRASLLRAWGAVPCPECARPLLPGVGEVGIPVEDHPPRS